MSEIVSGVEELPTGAVNVFAESGSEGAELLVSSPDVRRSASPVARTPGGSSRGPPPSTSSGPAWSWAERRRT